MSMVATGLASVGASILASFAGRRFAAGLLALATAALALVAFVITPQPFSAVLAVALAAAAAWLTLQPERRRAAALVAVGAGLLCAAALPHLAVLAERLAPEAGSVVLPIRLGAALAALAIGAALAGAGGAGLGLLGFAFEMGMLAAGMPMRWLIPLAIVAALLIVRWHESTGAAALAAVALLTLWEA